MANSGIDRHRTSTKFPLSLPSSKRLTSLTVVMAFLASAPLSETYAGGLWLNEYGDFAGGRASAGAAAGVDDASTMLHNPASMTRLKGGQLQLATAAIQPQFEFSQQGDRSLGPGGGDGGDAGVFSPSGGVFFFHDLGTERWRVGAYFSGLAGTGLDYDDDWVGRFQSIENSMMIAALAPTLAYQLTDRLSIGASLQLIAASLEVSTRTPALTPARREGRVTLDGTDAGVGFTLGVMYEVSPDIRIGIGYQSELEPDFSGDLEFERLDVSVQTNTTLTMAQKVRFGLHHQLNDHMSLQLSLGWDDWSALDEVFVAVADTGAGLRKDAKDTSHAALGFEYRFNSRWAMTGGVSYDSNPLDSDQRTADLPLDKSIHVAAGFEFRPSDDWKMAFYANYADVGPAKIKTSSWQGEYDTAALYQLGASVSWSY